jgi:hypothetical protein
MAGLRINDASSSSYRPPFGAWKNGLCACFSQCVPTCRFTPSLPFSAPTLTAEGVGCLWWPTGCAAYFCQPCLVSRFYDQFVRKGSYAYVLAVLVICGLAEVTFANMADEIAKDGAPDDDSDDWANFDCK